MSISFWRITINLEQLKVTLYRPFPALYHICERRELMRYKVIPYSPTPELEQTLVINGKVEKIRRSAL